MKMTKKVQNSSQSGVIEKKEVKADVVEIEPIQKLVITSDDLGTDPNSVELFIGAPFAERKDVRLKQIYDTKAIPTVHIAGEKVELKKLTQSEITKSKSLTRAIGECNGFYGRASSIVGIHGIGFNDISFDDIWFCNVAGVNIYLTHGSQVIVSNSFAADGHNYRDYRNWHDDETFKITPDIILIGSILEAHTLNVAENNTLLNSRVTSQSSLILINNTIKGSEININDNGYIDKSTISKSNIGSFDRINIEKCTLTDFKSFSSGGSLNLKSVISGHGIVRFSSYGRGNNCYDIEISNITLTPFEYFIHRVGNYAGLPSSSRVVKIKNRVDYGYFSGRDSIPFARLDNNDILVDGVVFSANEFFPELYASEKDKETKGHRYYHGYGNDDSVSGSKKRNGKLWLKALGVITNKEPTHTTNGSKPIGSLTDTLVETLLKQIESRLNLYIELNALDLC
jgi:predicted phosphodiesterase